jgi:hypothetical protein
MKVTILGAGPAGMFAAAACQNFGVMWEVWGKVVPKVAGPVFFHEPLVPSIRPAVIKMQLEGSIANYASRQQRTRTSANYFGLEFGNSTVYRAGWDPNIQMDMFYLSYMEHFHLGVNITDESVGKLLKTPGVYVINTLPDPELLRYPFPILVYPYEDPFEVTALTNGQPENFISYNGSSWGDYIRSGCLWGECFLEYTGEFSGLSDEEMFEVLRETFPALPPHLRCIRAFNIVHAPLPKSQCHGLRKLTTGRFATRNTRMLAHHSYADTWEWLEGLFR